MEPVTRTPSGPPSSRGDLRRRLAARWPLPGHEALRDSLLDAWDAPERGYHGLVHLEEVLDRLEELAPGLPHPAREVRLAAWFHDAVYDGAEDPEGRSAEWARLALTGTAPTGADVDVDEVVRLVLLTREHAPEPTDASGVVLCDADLAVLAAAPQRYAEYVAGVRREYAHLDDRTFTAGRCRVLRTFLTRTHLFSSPFAREHWEGTARRNVERELARLERTGE